MPRKRKVNRHPPVPSLRPHSSGRARVTLSGRTFYVGAWGSAEAHARYAELVRQWLANGRNWTERGPQTVADVQAIAERVAQQHGIPLPAAERVADVFGEFAGKLTAPEAIALAQARHPGLFVTEPKAAPLTIAQALAQYEASLDAAGRYVKNGRQTTERDIIRKAVAEFVAGCGDRAIGDLDAAMLLGHRDRLCARKAREARKVPATTAAKGVASIDAECAGSAESAERPLARTGVNRKVQTLKRALRWLKDRKILAREQWLDLADVAPLRRGELGDARDAKRAKRAVTPEEVEAVAAAAGPVVGAMLRLQGLTGMRPGEVCAMRWAEIDKAGPEVDGVKCWTYTVANGKTAHHGHETAYVLGPLAQEILAGFKATPLVAIFSPRRHVDERRRAMREARQTELTPSQRARDAGRSRRHGTQFRVDNYGKAILRACDRAKVARFGPHEVRHGFLTRAASTFGVVAASVAANHHNLTTTQGYLHPDRADAARVVLGLERAGPTDPGGDHSTRVG